MIEDARLDPIVLELGRLRRVLSRSQERSLGVILHLSRTVRLAKVGDGRDLLDDGVCSWIEVDVDGGRRVSIDTLDGRLEWVEAPAQAPSAAANVKPGRRFSDADIDEIRRELAKPLSGCCRCGLPMLPNGWCTGGHFTSPTRAPAVTRHVHISPEAIRAPQDEQLGRKFTDAEIDEISREIGKRAARRATHHVHMHTSGIPKA